MPDSKSFWEHPIDKLEEALSLRRQLAALQDRLSNLFSSESDKPASPSGNTGKPGRPKGSTVSPEARARMAAAQKARWAKAKGQTVSSQTSTPAQTGKRQVSPEARAKLAEAARRRWAKVKGTKSPG